MSKEWYVLLLSLAGMIFMLRYTRTPLFESYIVFMHPFIFLLTGWMIYTVYKKQAFIGLLILIIFAAGSLQTDLKNIVGAENRTAKLVTHIRNALIDKYPGKTFAVYDYNFNTKDKSVPLVLFLDEKNKNAEDGMKIGFMSGGSTEYDIILEKDGYIVVRLDNVPNTTFQKEPWGKITPLEIYRSTEEWYTYKK